MKIAKRGHGWFLGAGLLAGAVIIGAFLLLSITQHQGGTARSTGYRPFFPSKRIHSCIVHIKRKCEFSKGHLPNL